MSGKDSRLLGLVGGLGPNATVYYYNGLIAAHKAQGRVARMLIAHADVDHGAPARRSRQARRACALSQRLHRQMAAAGAEMAAIVAVTPHICSAQLLPLLKIPLIDMVATVADEIARAG